MSAATIEAAVLKTSRERSSRVASDGQVRTGRRPAQGGGRGVRPVSRARAGVAAPQVRAERRVEARSCASSPVRTVARPAAAAASAGWRLTNRGIAVVLITGAVLAAAALTVITATAITVTSADYHQPGHSALARR